MTRHELLQKITTFPLVAEGLAEEFLAGDFSSVFRGQGIEADEVRRYQIGDDVRSIDWNVSARFGTPYVKMYREERELSVYLCLDCSASMMCGSRMSRFEQAALIAALIAFSAERSGERLGAVFFDKGISKFFTARKGRHNTLAMINEVLNTAENGSSSAAQPHKAKQGDPSVGSNLRDALSGLGRILKRRSLIVVISDFFCINWEQEMSRICQKHDVIAIKITDPLDIGLFNAGLIAMEDPETGVHLYAPTSFSSFRSAWETWHNDRSVSWKAILRRAGAAAFEISTADDTAVFLIRFFRSRRRRR
ncbi:MAG: DUF58 domain-containing protein [Treponema sp.]|nr:DUF58 domain-containing protein [Treponema sp.]